MQRPDRHATPERRPAKTREFSALVGSGEMETADRVNEPSQSTRLSDFVAGGCGSFKLDAKIDRSMWPLAARANPVPRFEPIIQKET